MGVKLEAKPKRVLRAGDLALLITEWSGNGNEPNGNPLILLVEVRWFYVNSQMAPGL